MNEIRLIIAGGRDFNNHDLLIRTCDWALEYLIENNHSITVISGGARGADSCGETYAQARNFNLIVMNADWNQYGKRAGILRNIEMAKSATHCICFWDGKSRGTQHMIQTAQEYNLKLHVQHY